MNLPLDLDAHDARLLAQIRILGERGAKNTDEDRRLKRLQRDGYVTAIPHDPPGPGGAPAWNFRLTVKGMSAVQA